MRISNGLANIFEEKCAATHFIEVCTRYVVMQGAGDAETGVVAATLRRLSSIASIGITLQWHGFVVSICWSLRLVSR
jgi:hypothetical protein